MTICHDVSAEKKNNVQRIAFVVTKIVLFVLLLLL